MNTDETTDHRQFRPRARTKKPRSVNNSRLVMLAKSISDSTAVWIKAFSNAAFKRSSRLNTPSLKSMSQIITIAKLFQMATSSLIVSYKLL